MFSNANLPADDRAFLNCDAARKTRLRGNYHILGNLHVVSNVNKIVDLRAASNTSCFERSSIYR